MYSRNRTIPRRCPQTIPRNELNAMVLLVEAVKIVLEALEPYDCKIWLWSDSMVALSWVLNEKNWTTYVNNRVKKIRNSGFSLDSWKYVPTKDNPADLSTRVGGQGIVGVLRDLWQNGPAFISQNSTRWPDKKILLTRKSQCSIVRQEEIPDDLSGFLDSLQQISSFDGIVRTMAIILRWGKRNKGLKGFVTADEYEYAFQVLVRLLQKEHYSHEYQLLSNQIQVNKGSKLSSLTPFMDRNGIIRSYSRLEHADGLSDAEKLPIIFPNEAKMAWKLIFKAHEMTLHGGEKLTRRWITGHGIHMIKLATKISNVINSCRTCQAYMKMRQNQLMGMMPKWRVNVSTPFTIVGVDYAGPFYTRMHRGVRIVTRSSKIDHQTARKAYICIFICLTTKAIHLELISDLTSASFAAAYLRFISRRGIPALMMSDNGSTFKGAVNKKTARYKFLTEVNVLERQV